MEILIKQATIYCSSSPFNGKTKDILIKDGVIVKIADNITANATEIFQQDGLCVSLGWVDIFADFADPGFEHRETIQTGIQSAAAGGFTDVFLIPNCNPVIDNKSQVEYILQKSNRTIVTLHPIGAVTKNNSGKELSEMYDMKHSGAVAFSDGTQPIQNAGLLLKALQYVKSFGGTIIQQPEDSSIAATGLMNEGTISTQMGLPGKPIMAEEIMVARDLKLARYSNSKIHFSGITSPKSLEYINRSKESGIQVTCSITPYQAFFCDDDLQGYDTNLKLNPPLRSRMEMLKIKEALLNGTVDCIASHHSPQHPDNKVCEFEYAKSGMVGLETMFASMVSVGLPASAFVQMQTHTTRNIFGIPVPQLKEGENATLTLFNPDVEYIFDTSTTQSKSKNSAFNETKLKGKVIGIINKSQIRIN